MGREKKTSNGKTANTTRPMHGKHIVPLLYSTIQYTHMMLHITLDAQSILYEKWRIISCRTCQAMHNMEGTPLYSILLYEGCSQCTAFSPSTVSSQHMTRHSVNHSRLLIVLQDTVLRSCRYSPHVSIVYRYLPAPSPLLLPPLAA